MKSFRSMAVIVAVAAAFAVQSAPASAWETRSNGDAESAIALGIVGAAAGFIAGTALNGGKHPTVAYRSTPARDWRSPPRDHGRKHFRQDRRAVQPWSAEWYRYCTTTYRSFNPRTGTFRGYDGKVQFCQVPAPRYNHYR